MIQIKKDTIIGDILDMATDRSLLHGDRHALPGLPCFPRGDLEEACAVHGVDVDELMEKLNEHLAAKKA